MRYVVRLVVLLMALGWLGVEIQLGSQRSSEVAGPEWRRTSDGWIKVGASGAAALTRPDSPPASEPVLHPGLVAAFVLSAALLSLAFFDERRPSIDGVNRLRLF